MGCAAPSVDGTSYGMGTAAHSAMNTPPHHSLPSKYTRLNFQ